MDVVKKLKVKASMYWFTTKTTSKFIHLKKKLKKFKIKLTKNIL